MIQMAQLKVILLMSKILSPKTYIIPKEGECLGPDHFDQWDWLIKKVTKKTIKSLNPYAHRVDNNTSLNILGITPDDIHQELLCETFYAMESYAQYRTKNPIEGEVDENALFFGWVNKYLHNKSSQFVRDMWREKHGQAYPHLSGPNAEAMFNGGSQEDLEEGVEKLKAKWGSNG